MEEKEKKTDSLFNKLFFPYIPNDNDEVTDKTTSIVIGVIVGIIVVGAVVYLFFN